MDNFTVCCKNLNIRLLILFYSCFISHFYSCFFRCGLTIPVKKKMRNLYHLTTLVIFYLYINSQLLYGFCDYIVNLIFKSTLHFTNLYVFCLLTKVEKCQSEKYIRCYRATFEPFIRLPIKKLNVSTLI